jgi:hypothetical protein
MRLRYEGKENADEITDKASVFFGKTAEFVRQQPNLHASRLFAGPHPRHLLLRSATSFSTCFFCRTLCFMLPAPPGCAVDLKSGRGAGDAPLQLLHLFPVC